MSCTRKRWRLLTKVVVAERSYKCLNLTHRRCVFRHGDERAISASPRWTKRWLSHNLHSMIFWHAKIRRSGVQKVDTHGQCIAPIEM